MVGLVSCSWPSSAGFPTLAFMLIVLLQHGSLVESTSSIATFSDVNCQDSLSSFDGPNGYPNGTCSRLERSGGYGSFQVVNLDDGCSGRERDVFFILSSILKNTQYALIAN